MVELVHDEAIWVTLVGMVALIKYKQIDLQLKGTGELYGPLKIVFEILAAAKKKHSRDNYTTHVPVPLTQRIQQDLSRNHHHLSRLGDLGPDRLLMFLGLARATDLGHLHTTISPDGVGLLLHQWNIGHHKERELSL